jgi:predicted acyl esterase
MGSNKWQTSNTWPPAGADPTTFFLASGGRANSLNGDGALAAAAALMPIARMRSLTTR